MESLALADRSVLAEVFKSEAIAAGERLQPEKVVAALRARGQDAAVYADADAIVAGIAPELRAGDVVAILSNGGFGGIYEKLPKAIAKYESGFRRNRISKNSGSLRLGSLRVE